MKKIMICGMLSLGLAFGIISTEAIAQMPHDMETMQPPQTEQPNQQTGQFRQIEQPIGNKVAVTLGGLGLMGLELWWFLLSKPKLNQHKSRQAT